MDNQKILKALKLLIEARKVTTDEVLHEATKEELQKYIEISEEIEAKISMLLNE